MESERCYSISELSSSILEYADRKLQELEEKIDELMILRADILANKEKLLRKYK